MGVGMNEAAKLGGALATVGVAARMINTEANQKVELGQKAADQATEAQKELNQDERQVRYKEAAVTGATQETELAQKEFMQKLDESREFEKAVAADPNYSDTEKAEAKQLAKENFAGAEKKFLQAGKRKVMAKIALQNLNDEIEANRDILRRTQKPIEQGRAWGGKY